MSKSEKISGLCLTGHFWEASKKTAAERCRTLRPGGRCVNFGLVAKVQKRPIWSSRGGLRPTWRSRYQQRLLRFARNDVHQTVWQQVHFLNLCGGCRAIAGPSIEHQQHGAGHIAQRYSIDFSVHSASRMPTEEPTSWRARPCFKLVTSRPDHRQQHFESSDGFQGMWFIGRHYDHFTLF